MEEVPKTGISLDGGVGIYVRRCDGCLSLLPVLHWPSKRCQAGHLTLQHTTAASSRH